MRLTVGSKVHPKRRLHALGGEGHSGEATRRQRIRRSQSAENVLDVVVELLELSGVLDLVRFLDIPDHSVIVLLSSGAFDTRHFHTGLVQSAFGGARRHASQLGRREGRIGRRQ